jgi:hypothetical protein
MSLILSGTDGLSDVDGTAATPAIRGTDANTGIFFPAADTIAFAEGGVEAARFDSSGNFGLGVTPSAWQVNNRAIQLLEGYASISSNNSQGCADIGLNCYNTGSAATSGWRYTNSYFASLYQQTSGQHKWLTAASGTAGNAISFTQAMTLNASGNLGITETSPTAKLQISVASAVVDGTKGVRITNPGGTAVMFECGVSGDSFIGTTSGSDFNIRTGNTVRATFDTAGNLGLGSTSPINTAGYTGLTINNATNGGLISFATGNTQKGAVFNAGNNMYLDTNNVAGVLLIRNTATGATNTIQASGVITSPPTYANTSGGAANMFVQTDGSFYRSTSSLKYKTNVQDATHGLADLLQLRSVTYEGKAETDAGKTFGGLIAEEVHEAGLTEFVQYAEDGSPDALAYGNMVSLCIKAIQEQQVLITTLTARITALESA